jgi:uncharacterized protein YjbI with pentapeptide repeats
MRLREVAGRSMRRPEIDQDYLTDEPADFAGDVVFDEARVTDGDQTGVVGGGTVRDSILTGIDFTQARLSNLEISNSELSDLDLSNATAAVISMRTVELTTCRGIGLGLTIGQATDLYVEDSRFDYANIEITKASRLAVFHRCSFREARITGDLSDVVFSECDFTGADFAAHRADGCDLPESNLVGAHGLLTLRGARITQDQAVSVADVLATEAGLVVVP